MRFFGVAYYRCATCQKRFSGSGTWGERQRNIITALFLIVAMVLVIWFGMSLMGSGGMPPPPQ
jgi:hypothetical protein